MPLVVALNFEFVPADDLNKPFPLFLKVALTVFVTVVLVDSVILPSLCSSVFSIWPPVSWACLNSSCSARFSSSQNLKPFYYFVLDRVRLTSKCNKNYSPVGLEIGRKSMFPFSSENQERTYFSPSGISGALV